MAIVDDKSNKDKSAPMAGDHVDEPEPWLAWPELHTEVYDNITGRELPAELVAEARREEMRFLHDLDAYEVVPIEQSYTAMGRAPLPVGYDKHPKVRSRLVVKETRRNSPLQDAAAVFSSTPPFESLRFLASLAMTRQPDGARVDKTLFIDITHAHPHCHVTRELYIALPNEDPASTSGKSCGRLKHCLYGTRDAGRRFELFVYEVMTERLGCKGGVWNPCLFVHEERDILAFVYGDNFTALAERHQEKWFMEELSKHMWAKREGEIGPQEQDDRECVCLNK
eukprot:964751-Amphidinium_carterae.1